MIREGENIICRVRVRKSSFVLVNINIIKKVAITLSYNNFYVVVVVSVWVFI